MYRVSEYFEISLLRKETIASALKCARKGVLLKFASGPNYLLKIRNDPMS